MYKLIRQSGRARRGSFTTPHGTVQTPLFMNVGTQGAIKGALSARDLKEIGCQMQQGYLFGKPMPKSEFIEGIESGKYVLADIA